jgi:hypothetical protein
MLGAPRNAVFVWPMWGMIGYARALARHLGRHDLHITAPTRLAGLRGQGIRPVVVDHAARLTDDQSALVALLSAGDAKAAA